MGLNAAQALGFVEQLNKTLEQLGLDEFTVARKADLKPAPTEPEPPRHLLFDDLRRFLEGLGPRFNPGFKLYARAPFLAGEPVFKIIGLKVSNTAHGDDLPRGIIFDIGEPA